MSDFIIFLNLSAEEINNLKNKYHTTYNITKLIEHIKTKLESMINTNIHELLKNEYRNIFNIIKKNDNIDITKMNEFCEDFQFNGNIDIKKQKHGNSEIIDTDLFGDNTIPTRGYQYVIGRVNTLQKISETLKLYDSYNIRILHLDEEKHTKVWSMFLNDLFLYCSIIYDKHIQSTEKDYKFAIRLIYDKKGCNQTKSDKNLIEDKNSKCIATSQELDREHDVVTLHEIIVIGYIFGLKCYKYIGDKLKYSNTKFETFFFTSKDLNEDLSKNLSENSDYENITDKVLKFVENKKIIKEEVPNFVENKINIIEKGGYYEKYLKYKTQLNL